MFKNVASQKLTVFAFADAGHATLDPGEPVTGDAANIAAQISKDDGTPAASNDAAPTEIDATDHPGMYRFDLTQAETNCDKVEFTAKSSTAGVQVVALPSGVIYTRPQYFPDLGIASDGDLTKVNTLDGHTAQTADHTTNIASILTDTGTTLDNHLTDIKGTGFVKDTHSLVDIEAYVDLIDDGTSGLAKIATDAAAILVDTNSLNDTKIPDTISLAAINAEVDTAIETYGLDHLLGAAVIGTDVVDNSVIAKLVSASATADWDDFVNTDDSLQAISESGGGGPTAAAIADAVWDEAQADHTTGGSFGEVATEVASILVDTAEIGAAGAGLTDLGGMSTAMKAEVNAEADTALTDYDAPTKAELDTAHSTTDALITTVDTVVDGISTQIGTAGDGLTAIPWNATWDAEVQSEVNDGLVALGLDHLVGASVTGTDVTDNSIMAYLVSKSATADWDDFVNTTDSLQAIRDNQSGSSTTPPPFVFKPH